LNNEFYDESNTSVLNRLESNHFQGDGKMRNFISKRSASVVLGALTLAASPSAFALDKYIDLDPAPTKSGYGFGYNSISKEFVLRQCVEFAQKFSDDGSGNGGVAQHYSLATNSSQLADALGVSVGAKFSVSMGFASGSASEKVSFFQSTKTKMSTETIVSSFSDTEPMTYIAGEIKLKPEYAKLVSTPAFREQCGDYLIVGEQKGRWMYGTFQLDVEDTSTESRLATDGVVDASYATASMSVNEQTLEQIDSKTHGKGVTIELISSDARRQSTDLKGFLNAVRNFPHQNGHKETFKLKAVPYDAIVSNWPSKDILAPLTDADKLGIIASAAFTLQALIDDANFVTRNQSLFALGIAKKAARVNYLTARANHYQAALDDIRKRAKGCDSDWSPKDDRKDHCEKLYDEWKDFESYAIDEYAQFPIRKTANCEAPRMVNFTSNFGTLLGKDHIVILDHTKPGDADFGGGPGAFSAYLNVKPELTGGDPLDVRKLDAILSIHVEETKDDHSSFERTLKANGVWDLSSQEQQLGGSNVQCSYHGNGIKLNPIMVDTAACSAIKSLLPGSSAAEEVCKSKVGSPYEGLVHQTTAKDPKSFTFNKNTKGLISSITCDFSQGSHGTIRCGDISFLDVALDLVNNADVEADKWDAPKDANSKSTPKGLNPPAKRAAKLKELIQHKEKGNTATGPCKQGFTKEGGACVPATKR
jgi:hypothetical protein